jgi:hypothetical protein
MVAHPGDWRLRLILVDFFNRKKISIAERSTEHSKELLNGGVEGHCTSSM